MTTDESAALNEIAAGVRPAVSALELSKIREVANAGFGRNDLVRCWFGESDRQTPEYIRQSALSALMSGRTFYSHNSGNADLRLAIAGYLSGLHGRDFEPSRISVTSAGVSALMIAMQAILDPGDRVVAVAPVWPNLTEIPRILNAHLERVSLGLGATGAWTLDLDRLLAAITPETRLVLINSPGNPTGWMLPGEARQAILDRCRRLGVWLLCDDVYERLIYAPHLRAAPGFLAIAEPGDRVLGVNSFSKAWLMTGWRLGWLVAPSPMETDLGKLIEYNTSCAPDFVQAAGLAAITQGEGHVAELRRDLKLARDRLLAGLRAIPDVEAATPEGGMYVFFRIAGQTSSVLLAKRLIAEAGLGLAPGAAFGPEGEGWLRWCFAVDPATIDSGLERLSRWAPSR